VVSPCHVASGPLWCMTSRPEAAACPAPSPLIIATAAWIISWGACIVSPHVPPIVPQKSRGESLVCKETPVRQALSPTASHTKRRSHCHDRLWPPGRRKRTFRTIPDPSLRSALVTSTTRAKAVQRGDTTRG
jgi:hypothetical protein